MIPIQNRIEPEEISPLRLPPPERPEREHHDVPLPHRYIERDRVIRKRLPTGERPRQQHVIRIRRELHRAKIETSLIARHFHLSSPLHCQPACNPARVLFVTGEFDSIAPTRQIHEIQQKWCGSELLRVRQGHFGYRMLRETVARLNERGDLSIAAVARY